MVIEAESESDAEDPVTDDMRNFSDDDNDECDDREHMHIDPPVVRPALLL